MRQIIELVSSLINKNPRPSTKQDIKNAILHRDLLIVCHKDAQPLVKPAFKSLESFVTKRTVNSQDLLQAYRNVIEGRSVYENDPGFDGQESWDGLIAEAFSWMSLPDVSPAAGKFLVTVFRAVRGTQHNDDLNFTVLWHRWIQEGLEKVPESLENVKYYLFPPLFKLDRPGSIRFLQDLNDAKLGLKTNETALDAQALLYLAAIDIGKKTGLVEGEVCD